MLLTAQSATVLSTAASLVIEASQCSPHAEKSFESCPHKRVAVSYDYI